MFELIVRYAKSGGLICPDESLYDYARFLWESRLTTPDVVVSNEMLVMAIRVLIKQGKIPYDKIAFEYVIEDGDAVLIAANKDGRLELYPSGFCDTADDMLSILLEG